MKYWKIFSLVNYIIDIAKLSQIKWQSQLSMSIAFRTNNDCTHRGESRNRLTIEKLFVAQVFTIATCIICPNACVYYVDEWTVE